MDLPHELRTRLIRETQDRLRPTCRLILLSASAAVDYYPNVGFERHPQAWTVPPGRLVDREVPGQKWPGHDLEGRDMRHSPAAGTPDSSDRARTWYHLQYGGMSSRESGQTPGSQNAGRFATTRWSMVVEAGRPSSPNAAEALATLCGIYWFPLYAYVRRRGQSIDDAQDLTQAFFVHLLDNQTLRVADRERGRFRSFLLASMKHFLAKQWRRDAAQKRGGGRAPISLDFDDGETRYRLEPSHNATPEKLFERQWALTLLARALAALRAEFDASGKAARFASLKMFVGGEKSTVPYRELADRLEMSEGAVKVAIHRMRRRYRALLREEIRHTIGAAEDVDDELRRLFDALTP